MKWHHTWPPSRHRGFDSLRSHLCPRSSLGERRPRSAEKSVRFRPGALSGCSSGVRARGRGPRGRWCDSSHSDRGLSGRSSAAERVADYHEVTGAIPVVRTRSRSASPSGTGLASKAGQQCSIHWRRARPGPRSEHPTQPLRPRRTSMRGERVSRWPHTPDPVGATPAPATAARTLVIVQRFCTGVRPTARRRALTSTMQVRLLPPVPLCFRSRIVQWQDTRL